MALMQVYEGTLDEIVARYGQQLNGRHLKVIVEEQGTEETKSEALETDEAEAKPFWQTATPEEWSKAWREWTDGHDPDTPVLSDEAMERESIYEGREE